MNTRVIGFNVTDSVMYPPPVPGSADPGKDEPLVFAYDTGQIHDGWICQFSGGPILGPAVAGVRQHIYYFADDYTLVALTNQRPIPGDFDGDRDVDVADYNAFMACVSLGNGPNVTILGTGCETRDLDGDQDVDLSDFGIFQACFTGMNVIGDPNCKP